MCNIVGCYASPESWYQSACFLLVIEGWAVQIVLLMLSAVDAPGVFKSLLAFAPLVLTQKSWICRIKKGMWRMVGVSDLLPVKRLISFSLSQSVSSLGTHNCAFGEVLWLLLFQRWHRRKCHKSGSFISRLDRTNQGSFKTSKCCFKFEKLPVTSIGLFFGNIFLNICSKNRPSLDDGLWELRGFLNITTKALMVAISV